MDNNEQYLGYYERIYKVILQETERQSVLWGRPQDHSMQGWFAILAEEIGEVARAVVKYDMNSARLELIHCAAVIFSWLGEEEAKVTPPQENEDGQQAVSQTVRKGKGGGKTV